jgi:hypothetical protein
MDPFQNFFETIWPFYVILRAVFIVLDVLLLFLAIFAAVELLSYRPHFSHDPMKAAERRKRHAKTAGPTPKTVWKAIRDKAEAGTREAMRIAVIEADTFVDSILKKQGYVGETFADRLTQFNPRETVTLDRAWDAHRLRNDIVHTHGFEVTPDAVRIALDNFEAFLYEVGGL